MVAPPLIRGGRPGGEDGYVPEFAGILMHMLIPRYGLRAPTQEDGREKEARAMRGRDKHRAHGDMGSISTTPRATGFFRPAAQSACGKGSFSRQGREEWAARCGATRGGACGVRGAHRGVKWGESVGRGRCSMRSGRAVRSGQGGACGAKGAQSGHWGHRACGRVVSTWVLREQKWCRARGAEGAAKASRGARGCSAGCTLHARRESRT